MNAPHVDAAAPDSREAPVVEAAAGAAEPMGRTGKMDDRMMNTEAAADYLGLSPRTLDTYRWAGTGPDYYKMGRRVCYRRARLDEWAEERRRRSTSDDGGGRDGGGGRRPRGSPPATRKNAARDDEADRPEA